MGDNQAARATGATQAKRRSSACPGSSSPHRYHLRTAKRSTLGDATPRDGLWEWSNMLASPSRLARGRSMAQATPSTAQPPGRSRQDRLVKSQLQFGYHPSQRCKKGDPKASAIGRNPTDKGNSVLRPPARNAILWSKPKAYPFR